MFRKVAGRFCWALLVLSLALGGCTNISAGQLPAPLADIHQPPPAPYNDQDGWHLLFRDEFEGNALDTDKWQRCYWWDDQGCTIASNGELEWYLPGNVQVVDGKLRLAARPEQTVTPGGETYAYTSGMVTTGRPTYDRTVPANFAFQYGYAEIRAKIPAGQGLWPAFWLLPETHRATPEIDVLEILGHEPNKLYMFLHNTNEQGEDFADGTSVTGPDFSADWHTFAIDWSPNALIWYVDGEEYFRIDEAGLIPATPMYLILNLAVGGEWPGPPDETTRLPAHFEVDYVRVWTRHTTTELTTVARAAVDATAPAQAATAGAELVLDDDPMRLVYLTFDTSALADTTIDAATLRILTDGAAGTRLDGTYAVFLVQDAAWSSASLQSGTLPQLAAAPLGTLTYVATDEIYDIRLDAAQLQPYLGGQVTFALLSVAGEPLHLYPERAGIQQIRLSLISARAGHDGAPVVPPAPSN